MKTMLFAGAALMIGASIYGFVDYKQTSNKTEFTSMYESQDIKPAVIVEEKKPAVTQKELTSLVKNKKNPVKKTLSVRKVEAEETLPVIKPISEADKINEKETKAIENTTVDVKTSKTILVKKPKKKKINSKLFSRAPLREEEEVMVEPVKIDPDSNREKKSSSKEQ